MNFNIAENTKIRIQFYKWSLIFLCIIFSTYDLSAQFYRLEKYSELDGLISSSVNTIFQDNRDYLWLGTEKVLSIYNGYEFKNYTIADGLNNNFIKCIYQSSDNSVWIGSNEGINKIDPSQGPKAPIINIQKGLIVTSIIEYNDVMFFSSNIGLHKLTNNDSIELIELPRIRTLSIVNGKLLIGSSSGLYEYQSESKSVEKIWASSGSESVRSIMEKGNSSLLIGTMNEIIELDNDYSESHKKADVGRVSHLMQDAQKRTWIASENGLNILIDDSLSSFKDSDLNKTCSYVLEDREKNIWIAGIDGLIKYSEYPFDRIDFTNSIESNGISAVLNSTEGKLWYGTSAGQIWIEDFKGDKYQFEPVNQYSGNKPINDIFEDSKGKIWISTLLNGVLTWDGKKLQSLKDPKGLLRFFIFDMEEASNGAMWFGGARGLIKYENDAFEYFTFANSDQTPFVNDIFIDSDHRIWLSLNSGLGVIRNNKIFKFSEFEGISCNQLSATKENTFYAATSTFGIIRFKFLKDSIKIERDIRVDEGLSNNNVNAVHIDVNENVWAGTELGINKITDGKSIELFKVGENLLRSKTHLRAIAENSSDIIIGTYDGAIKISKTSENDTYVSPKTFITEISILNDNFDSSKVKQDGFVYNLPVNLQLPYNANFIAFSFEGLSFETAERPEYQYRLKGLEKEFSEPGKERNFTYANLDDGKYTFEVRSRKSNEKWSDETASFSFEIKPPFWEEWWFRILIVTLFFGSIFLIVNGRIQNIRKEEKEKSELNRKIAEFRLTALRAQMNPHFIFNALYSIQHFITTNEKEAAINYLAKFASLIRLILEKSDKNEIQLSEEVKMLDLYLDLEKLRFDNKFEYAIQVDQAIHEEDTAIPYLLIQPFVENAVIHGVGYKKGNGLISIKFLPCDDENHLLCIVEDNGVGREEAERLKKPSPIKSQSLGLKVNNERLEILNPNKIKDTSVKITDLTNEKGDPAGTRVEIRIPIS